SSHRKFWMSPPQPLNLSRRPLVEMGPRSLETCSWCSSCFLCFGLLAPSLGCFEGIHLAARSRTFQTRRRLRTTRTAERIARQASSIKTDTGQQHVAVKEMIAFLKSRTADRIARQASSTKTGLGQQERRRRVCTV
ncbi:hypothetical protein B0H12DRAFT_1126589, partial [Mycena haematopus]